MVRMPRDAEVIADATVRFAAGLASRFVESSLYILVGFAIGADRAPRLRPRMGKGIAMNATERAVAVVERMLAQPGFSATEPATRVLVAEITVAIARAQLEAQREIWQSLVDLAAPKVADAEEALAHLRQAEATLLALELTSHAPPVHGPEAEG